MTGSRPCWAPDLLQVCGAYCKTVDDMIYFGVKDGDKVSNEFDMVA